MTGVVAAKTRARSTRTRAPTWRFVPAGGAAKKHPTVLDLQQGIVAGNSAHRARQRARGLEPPGSQGAERLNGATNDLNGRVCKIRRHGVRVSSRAHLRPMTLLPQPAFRRGVNGRHPCPYQRSCHVCSCEGNRLICQPFTRVSRNMDELQSVREFEQNPTNRLSEIRSVTDFCERRARPRGKARQPAAMAVQPSLTRLLRTNATLAGRSPSRRMK